MAEIYHMARAADWPGSDERYRNASLESEGFVHCTAGERNLLEVAERHYAGEAGDWLVLVIDPARVEAEIRWQVQADAMAYPHLHGPLNRDAVVAVLPFPRAADGTFLPFR
jgi:uncharacterized protein (DUF952 family)